MQVLFEYRYRHNKLSITFTKFSLALISAGRKKCETGYSGSIDWGKGNMHTPASPIIIDESRDGRRARIILFVTVHAASRVNYNSESEAPRLDVPGSLLVSA